MTIAHWLCLASFSLLTALIAPSASSADFGIVPGSVEVRTLDSGGNPDTRAGAHPARLLVNYKLDIKGTAVRDLMFEFGPGLTGTPFATPVCPRAVFEDQVCPANTQVGVFSTTFAENGGPSLFPIYNVAPTPSQIATLGFVPTWQTELGMVLRPTDYGLSMSTTDMLELPSTEGAVELWGIPADHVGGPERTPFLTTPPECGPLKVVFRARSWEADAPWVSETGETLPFTDCENLPLEPDLEMQLTDPVVDSPTGAQVDLNIAAHSGPNEQVSANLKEVTIDFPHGVTVSPGSVEGMEVCRDAQFGLSTASTVTCPFRSRVGTVEITTPQLSEVLTGPVFLGEELPGERFRLFVDATAPGIPFKALAKLKTDPQTGDLSAVLSGLPQVALSRITLNLDNGSAPLLASPLSCGQFPTQAQFVPYGPHEPVGSSALVDIESRPGSTCADSLGFSPDVVAGSTQGKAGEGANFSFTLSRRDGEQLAKRFSVALPEGLNANLTTVDVCGDSAAGAGTCPASSKIGSAVAEVGSGGSPALVRGGVYLTGPYRGAPFGLSVVFDATIGPFHLGSLNLRGMLNIDPHSGQHSLEIDSLPTIFEGVALRFRTVGVDLDRPGFIVSPTSCKPAEILARVSSVDGRTVSIANPFYLDGCDELRFKPGFSLSVKDGSRPQGSSKPKLTIQVRGRGGDANLRQFEVKFPRLLAFHSGNVPAICARGDAVEDLCPAASRVGTSVGRTPLLKEELRGPVYLVQPKGDGLPGFLISLAGGGVPLQLTGESFRRDGRVVTKMVNLPDIPLSMFTLHLNGGKDGLFSLRRSPCRGSSRRGLASPVALQAQDGAYRAMTVQLKASCATGHRGRKRIVGRQASDRQR